MADAGYSMMRADSADLHPTVLLVDDQIEYLSTLIHTMLAAGFQIVVATSGAEALARARVRRPDLILLDVNMPDMDGYETCRRLKADEQLKHVPVIFISAHTESDDKVHGLQAGGVDYVTKPIDNAEVLLRIDTHLKLRALQQALEASNRELERRVQERTAALTAEIERRKQFDHQQTIFLNMLRTQGEQLLLMSKQMFETHLRERVALSAELDDRIVQNLHTVRAQLLAVQSHMEDDATLHQLDAVTRQLSTVESYARHVMGELQQASPESTAIGSNPLLQLSMREREVLLLLVKQVPIEAIAALLVVSASTVRTYRLRIARKLGVASIEALVPYVLNFDLTTID